MIVAGLPTIVPTLVSELVTSAFTVSPPRSSCVVTHLSVVGLSRAASHANRDVGGERIRREVVAVQDEPGRIDRHVARAVVVARRLDRERRRAERTALDVELSPRRSLVTLVNVTLVPPATVPSRVIVASVGVVARHRHRHRARRRRAERDADGHLQIAADGRVGAIVMFGAVTVAVTDWKSLGVEKPSGVDTLIVVVPAVGRIEDHVLERVAAGERRRTAA